MCIRDRRVSASGKGKRRVVQYLIKWLGYPEEANSWEPAKNVSAALIADFEARQRNAQQPPQHEELQPQPQAPLGERQCQEGPTDASGYEEMDTVAASETPRTLPPQPTCAAGSVPAGGAHGAHTLAGSVAKARANDGSALIRVEPSHDLELAAASRARFQPLLAQLQQRARADSVAAGGATQLQLVCSAPAADCAVASVLGHALGGEPLPALVGGISGTYLSRMLEELRAEAVHAEAGGDGAALRLIAARAEALLGAAMYEAA